MEHLVGGAKAGGGLGNLVDGFLERDRLAEQMAHDGMVDDPGTASPNAAMANRAHPTSERARPPGRGCARARLHAHACAAQLLLHHIVSVLKLDLSASVCFWYFDNDNDNTLKLPKTHSIFN